MTNYEAIQIAYREIGWSEEEIRLKTEKAAFNAPGAGNKEIPRGDERAVIDAFKAAFRRFSKMTPEKKEQLKANAESQLRQRTKGN